MHRPFLLAALCLTMSLQPVYAMPIETFHQWLESSWGETDENGLAQSSAHGRDYSCGTTHNLPENLHNRVKGRGVYGIYFDGALAFSVLDGELYVISGYRDPRQSLNEVDVTQIPNRLGTEPEGNVILELEVEIPHIPYPRMIIPLTNHRFKLAAPVDKKGGFGGARNYYFKRCGK